MDKEEIEQKAKQLRFEALKMVYEAQEGHPGPALSVADIVAVLFYDTLRLDPKNPDWEDRDRFILSKGHAYSVY